MKNKYIGSDFDSFLEEEGIKEEVESGAVKKILSLQIIETMNKEKLTNRKFMRRRARLSAYVQTV